MGEIENTDVPLQNCSIFSSHNTLLGSNQIDGKLTLEHLTDLIFLTRVKKLTTQDELRNLQETTETLEDEAKEAALNLAGYRFQSRLTVFAYWPATFIRSIKFHWRNSSKCYDKTDVSMLG